MRVSGRLPVQAQAPSSIAAPQQTHRLGHVEQDHATTFGIHGMHVVGSRVEIIPDAQAIFSDAKIAFENEYLLSARMDVTGITSARLKAQEDRGRPIRGLVVAQDFDIYARDAR